MLVFNFFLKIFIVILVAVICLFIVGKLPPTGAIGFRPIDDGCYGFGLENKEVYGNFPKGKVRVNFFNLEYYVPEKAENKSPRGFCLGKNFWDKKNWEKKQQDKTGENMEETKTDVLK